MNLSELFGDGDYRFHMALQRGSAAEFFQPTADHTSILAERRRWLAADPDAYCFLLPEGEPLLTDCLKLAHEWRSLVDEGVAAIASGASPKARCLELARHWEPDFLLLQPDDTGTFQLVGGSVCFPSSWSLAEKAGQPLASIHAPVPGLNPQLGRSIDAFLARLAPGPAWLRHNWGLSRTNELNQHPSRNLPRLDSETAPDAVWLRVEHQALVSLPQTGGVLFGIRIAHHPLTAVKQDATAAPRLARALRTMAEPVAAYKGLATARGRIAAWLMEQR